MSNQNATQTEVREAAEDAAVIADVAAVEADYVPNGLEDIFEDMDETIADLPASTLRPNPVVEVGKINTFEDVYPLWTSKEMDSLEALPDERRAVTSAIDLTKGEIVLTRMSFYEQRKQEFILAGGDLENAKPENLNTQCEIDLALPGAIFGFIDTNGELIPHLMYTRDQLSRMRARALVAYTKTRFNAPRELIMGLHDKLMEHGFEHVTTTRERMGEMRRQMIFNIQAPLVGNPSSTQMRLRQQQDTGYRLHGFTLVAPRDETQRYRETATNATRPEFEGFAWHLADNVRWATALTAAGIDGLQAFSLTTAITGIDHRPADDTRPMGNALRATIQSLTYADRVPDSMVRKALELPDAVPVTAAMRAIAERDPLLQPTLTEINFFATAAVPNAA